MVRLKNRRKKKAFNGKVELNKTPMSLSKKIVYFVVKEINVQLSKKIQKISVTIFGKKICILGSSLLVVFGC
jgi:hypothetical protein